MKQKQPLPDPSPEQRRGLLRYMEGFISENKSALFDKAIANRTRHITVVLEDIYQSHNASAVLRTCDFFGIQDIHIIENHNKYNINPDVALGATKWLSLIKFNQQPENTLDCYESLRKKGYRIVATSPHTNDKMLDELPLGQKFALVFGTELNGLTKTAIENADEDVKIPMYGFTESFNISVSAAIILHHLTETLRASHINWQLSSEEMTDIRLQWVRSVLKRPEIYEREYFREKR